jgi:hypothetical protein
MDHSCIIALPGGRTLTVRPATTDDAGGLEALYGSLSTDDRRRRFFTGSRPPRGLIQRFLETTDKGGLWLVAVTDGDEIVADGGYTMRSDGDGELALTVKRPWRGWLGAYLLDAVLSDAAERGVKNLRADILAENRPMLRLIERRGFATVNDPDWTVVTAIVPTHGPRPCWPPSHLRRRLLVEGAGGRWHGAAEAWRDGWDVVSCAGPGSRQVPACPIVDGRPCPLVEGADLVVVATQPKEDIRAALLACHAQVRSSPPILDEATVSAEQLSLALNEPHCISATNGNGSARV